MTSLEELKQLIDYIHRRLPSEEKIDAAEHNRILKTLVDTLAGIGANVFLGITTPETIPEQSPAIKCFYLATKKGNYPHFGDLVINSPLAVIYWNGFDWEKHEIEVSVNVNVDINDFVDLSNFAKLTADNEFVGNQKIIGSLEIGETRGKLRPAVTRNREMADGNATVWDDLLKVIKTVKQVPDSKLFNEHAWEDWFNQALRTFDDVKFKSLKSTEFETKVKGWIIDAMGDAEFRKLILREGFKTADFIPGVLGAGTGMVGTEDFTTGKLTVRNYMEVMALAIAQVFWRGGQDVYSPSGMKVNKVEEYGDYWRCYMDTSEGQVNTCTIGAQMRCDKYGDGKKKYYWNLVTNTGENYIDLSKTDRDGVDVPEVGDELAQCVNTDPPYGISLDGGGGNGKRQKQQIENNGMIANDELTDDDLLGKLLIPAFKNAVKYSKPDAAFYIYHATDTRRDFEDAMTAAGLLEKQYLIWLKNNHNLSGTDYLRDFEPMFYAEKAGHMAKWCGDRSNNTCWKITLRDDAGMATTLSGGIVVTDGAGGKAFISDKVPKGKKIRYLRLQEDKSVFLYPEDKQGAVWEVARDTATFHPTQKPVELATRAILNSSDPGDIILDLFGGSGFTLIGAEMTERQARLVELSPTYCDGIIRRYVSYTGNAGVTCARDGKEYAYVQLNEENIKANMPDPEETPEAAEDINVPGKE